MTQYLTPRLLLRRRGLINSSLSWLLYRMNKAGEPDEGFTFATGSLDWHFTILIADV